MDKPVVRRSYWLCDRCAIVLPITSATPSPPLLPLIVILIELSLCDSIQLSLRMSINYLCVTLIASRCGSDDCGHSVCVCERKRVWEGDRLCVCVWLFMPNGSKLNFNVCCAYTHTPSRSIFLTPFLSLSLLNMLASFIIYFNYILMPTNSLSLSFSRCRWVHNAKSVE